ASERGLGAGDGVAGAELGFLHDVAEGAINCGGWGPGDGGADLIALVADDDDIARRGGSATCIIGSRGSWRLLGTMVLRVAAGALRCALCGDCDGFACGAKHMFEHGAPTDGVCDLGAARTHSRAFAGGQDDDPDTSHALKATPWCAFQRLSGATGGA